MRVKTGVEVLIEEMPSWLTTKRIGLLCNQASVTPDFLMVKDILVKSGVRLTTLFSPQHGFYSERQDNMIESGHTKDITTGLPIYSLYSKIRKPDISMLKDIDILLVDLQDVGTRVYTFISTLANTMQACCDAGIKVIILDRPNPINGQDMEGNLLDIACSSFVGMFPLPMRHGMTMGEIALIFKYLYKIDCELEVIAMDGWKRSMLFPETGLPWVMPSPNMPLFDSAMVYPGQVIFEGTNISEGRGTTRPFEICGAPFIDPYRFLKIFNQRKLKGFFLRPIFFEPTFHKYSNKTCAGFFIHITDTLKYKPYLTTICFIIDLILLYPDHFKWKNPPYEYEYNLLPIQLILGDLTLYKTMGKNPDMNILTQEWDIELNEFREKTRPFLLYK